MINDQGSKGHGVTGGYNILIFLLWKIVPNIKGYNSRVNESAIFDKEDFSTWDTLVVYKNVSRILLGDWFYK